MAQHDQILRLYKVMSEDRESSDRAFRVVSALPRKNRECSTAWLEKGSGDEQMFLRDAGEENLRVICMETRRCAQQVENIPAHKFFHFGPTSVSVYRVNESGQPEIYYGAIVDESVDICFVVLSKRVQSSDESPISDVFLCCSSRFRELYVSEGWTGLTFGDEIWPSVYRVAVDHGTAGPMRCDRIVRDEYIETIRDHRGRQWIEARFLVDVDIQKYTEVREVHPDDGCLSFAPKFRLIVSARMLHGICVNKLNGVMDNDSSHPILLRYHVVDTEETVLDLE